MGIDVSAVNRLHLSCGKAEIAPINVPLGHTHARRPTYTCYVRTHTHTPPAPLFSIQQTRIYGTIVVNHPGRSISENQHRCCILLELHSDFENILDKAREIPEPFDSTSHPPSVAILQQLLCCSHFVSLPFSTLLSFSWGCQMARVKPPPSPTSHPIICDRLDDRQIDGQTHRQTERQKEGR